MLAPKVTSTSRQSTQKLEWQVCEDDTAWEEAQRTLAPSPANVHAAPARGQGFWRRYGLYVFVIFVISVSGGGWWVWQRAETGIAQVETELEAAVAAELWQADPLALNVEAAEMNFLNKLSLPADVGEIITDVKIHGLGEDWAVVDVTIQPAADGPSYRQTRVYLADAHGWRRTQASAARWGTVRQLESHYFTFVYHDHDEAAVKQAAPQIDALYSQLHRDLYGTVSAHQKLKITLNPTQIPGLIYQDGYPQPGIVLPSPASALRPSDLNAGDMLVQSLVLAIFDRQTTEKFATHIPLNQWFQLHSAYRLWFIGEHDLALARWRTPLVQWIFEESGYGRDPYAVPAFASDLCAHHTLWMRSPLHIGVPVLCWQSKDGTEMFSAWRKHYKLTELSLDSLLYSPSAHVGDVGMHPELAFLESGPNDIVLATFFEYVTATYGKSMMPLLLTKIAQHQHADTLIPEVFGVPLSEFEEGWRTFLVERYALELPPAGQ